GEGLDSSGARFLVHIDRQVVGLVPIAGGDARILQQQTQEQRQRERHADDAHGHQCCKRLMHDAAERADQDLRMARKIRVDAHAGSAPTTRPSLSTIRRAPTWPMRCTSWLATTTVTPTSLKRLNS